MPKPHARAHPSSPLHSFFPSHQFHLWYPKRQKFTEFIIAFMGIAPHAQKKSDIQGCWKAFGYSLEATSSNKIMRLQLHRKLLLVQSLGLIKTYPINVKKFTHKTFLLLSWNLKFYSRCLKSCIIYKISAIHSGAINAVLWNKASLHFKGCF